jgi:hypothetical protein
MADFEARYGAIAEMPIAAEIPISTPKQEPRRLREDHEQRMYVAETLVEGEVRETEIVAFTDRDDEALDFFVYDNDGALMDRSRFVTILGEPVVSATPFACMSCHVDFERSTYDLVDPAQ